MKLSNIFGNISVNIFLLLFLMIMLNGCFRAPASYKEFEMAINANARLKGGSFIPNYLEKNREIYSKDTYIYIERSKGCTVGYFTNRDNNPEKVIGWVILKGEECCILQMAMFAFQDSKGGCQQ